MEFDGKIMILRQPLYNSSHNGSSHRTFLYNIEDKQGLDFILATLQELRHNPTFIPIRDRFDPTNFRLNDNFAVERLADWHASNALPQLPAPALPMPSQLVGHLCGSDRHKLLPAGTSEPLLVAPEVVSNNSSLFDPVLALPDIFNVFSLF